MKKPKKINRKLRDNVTAGKGMNYDMKDALDAAFKALQNGEHDDVKGRLEQIQLNLKV